MGFFHPRKNHLNGKIGKNDLLKLMRCQFVCTKSAHFLQATPAMTKSTRKAGIIVEMFTVCLGF